MTPKEFSVIRFSGILDILAQSAYKSIATKQVGLSHIVLSTTKP